MDLSLKARRDLEEEEDREVHVVLEDLVVVVQGHGDFVVVELGLVPEGQGTLEVWQGRRAELNHAQKSHIW